LFRIKQNSDGSVARYKARLVAKGFTQKKDIDYTETFAPVVRFSTLRLILALSALYGYQSTQVDIATAFLNAPIEEEIYMEQPEGFIKLGSNGEKLVCRMKRSLYGLKQSPRNWNKTLGEFLLNCGFQQSKTDPCLYFKLECTPDNFFVITVYVDDMVITVSNPEDEKRFLKMLEKRFKFTNLGHIHWLLGTGVIKNENSVTIHLEKYITDTLRKFRMENCKLVRSPMGLRHLTPEEREEEDKLSTEKHALYRNLIGRLIFIATICSPDISFAVAKLSQHLVDPVQSDWTAAL
jgi:hypothetical protein